MEDRFLNTFASNIISTSTDPDWVQLTKGEGQLVLLFFCGPQFPNSGPKLTAIEFAREHSDPSLIAA